MPKIKFDHGFPIFGLPTDGPPTSDGGDGDTPPPSMDPGWYYRTTDNDQLATDAVAANWTPTTKLNDVGAGDETTYESGNVSGYLKALLVLDAATAYTAWAGKVFTETPGLVVYYSVNGTDWTIWFNTALPSNLSHLWTATSDTSGDSGAQVYFQFCWHDIVVNDAPEDLRVGDIRLS